jgi:hypothetical protein
MSKVRLIILLIFSSLFFSCENSKEVFISDSISDYISLQQGKYITYRIDSLVFTQNGSNIEVHKYQVKHTVQGETTDNLGRKAFIINRLIRNEAGTSSWTENGNYLVIPLSDRIEIIENNLRTVPLRIPFTSGFSWKGNSYLPFAPYKPMFGMEGAGNDMNKWDFVYTYHGDTTVQNQSYKNVWTVTQSNTTLNIPPTSGTQYGYKEVAREQYAKNIGLVYRDFQLYDYQGPNADNRTPAYYGFGITMWMIDHN